MNIEPNYTRFHKNSGNEAEKSAPYEWRNQQEHALFFLVYLLDWGNLNILIYEDGAWNPIYRPTVLHYLIVCLLVGYPMIFLQNFFGQFTRKGCMVIGYMLPLVQGFGYTMLICAMIGFGIQIFYSAALLSYLFFAIINTTPPWMVCFKSFYMLFPNCFSLQDIDLCPTATFTKEPCFLPRSKTLAPDIFRKVVVFKRETYNANNPMAHMAETWYNMASHAINISVIYLMLVVAASKRIRNIDVGLRLSLYFCLASALSIIGVVLTQPGALEGFEAVFKDITLHSLVNLDVWTACFRRVVDALKLNNGGLFLFGSFIPRSNLAPRRAMFLTFVFYIYILFIMFYYYTFESFLIYKLNLTIKELNLESEEKTVFVLYPTVLGTLASTYFFSVTYFLLVCLLNLNSLVLKMFVIEMTLRNHFKTDAYYFYIRFIICTIGVAATFPVMAPNISPHVFKKKYEMKTAMMTSFFFQLIIVQIYGLQRLCDDIYFFFNTPASNFLKVCWVIMPIYYVVFLYEYIIKTTIDLQITTLLMTIGLIFVPFSICLVFQIFKYMKLKYLMGLLRPVSNFGPPEVELRILRILYNPRLSVRYLRHVEICTHECLMQSPTVRQAANEEIKLVGKLNEALTSGHLETDVDVTPHLRINEILLERRVKNLL